MIDKFELESTLNDICSKHYRQFQRRSESIVAADRALRAIGVATTCRGVKGEPSRPKECYEVAQRRCKVRMNDWAGKGSRLSAVVREH